MTNKKIPVFSSEKKEQVFWEKSDSTEYLDWQRGEVREFSYLKPSTQTAQVNPPPSSKKT